MHQSLAILYISCYHTIHDKENTVIHSSFNYDKQLFPFIPVFLYCTQHMGYYNILNLLPTLKVKIRLLKSNYGTYLLSFEKLSK